LDLDLFTSPKPKLKPKPKQNKGPNKKVWHTAIKEFRITEPDIFTMDIELVLITILASSPASSILEYKLPKKRKAGPVLVPAKRRQYTKRPAVVDISELAEIPVVQSRAGRVVQRTDKAKAFY
jgi:hypothetical protein